MLGALDGHVVPGSFAPVHVSSDGGSPNAAQRKRLADLLRTRPQRAAILIASSLVRGAITVLPWLEADLEANAFTHADLEGALRFLELPWAHAGGRLRDEMDRLRATLTLPRLPRA